MKAKQKQRSLFVILAVSALTLYNILPTLFFYSNDLKAPINEKRGMKVAKEISQRVNKIADDSVAWINSYCELLKIKPTKISYKKKHPDTISVSFPSEKEAKAFKAGMSRAGNLIPFFPKRMVPIMDNPNAKFDANAIDHKTVVLKREIPIHFSPSKTSDYFSFGEMYNADGSISKEYREILNDRVLTVSRAITHESSETVGLEKSFSDIPAGQKTAFYLPVAEALLNYKSLFEGNSSLQKRFVANLFRSPYNDPSKLYSEAIKGFQSSRDIILKEKITLKEQMETDGIALTEADSAEVSALKSLERKEALLLDALTFLQNQKWLEHVKSADYPDFGVELTNQKIAGADTFTLSTGVVNPVISALNVDYEEHKITFEIDSDVTDFIASADEAKSQKIQQLVYDEISKVKRYTNDRAKKEAGNFVVDLNSLRDAKSFLKLDLSQVAKSRLDSLMYMLEHRWTRESDTFSKENYKIISWDEYKNLDKQDKHFSLVLYSPLVDDGTQRRAYKNTSLYIIAKDMLRLYKNFEANGFSEENSSAYQDVMSLQNILRQYGVMTYAGNSYPFDERYANDIIFEIPDVAGALIAATREDFKPVGSNKYAVLEFSDVKNRIITLNDIENKEHADLLKWNDDFNQARVNPESEGYLSVPAPTKSPFFSNLALSATKYFRGDERKILHWGIDLEGGTTVSVALKDKQNKKVNSEADLNQGISELYRRVNKMGVSDVSIRKEGSLITLDFPTTQSMSAQELVTSSSMTFHIVNEKFSMHNVQLRSAVSRFLQEVWNEALVTDRTDAQNINRIAFNHLYGDPVDEANALPRSDSGRILLESGLTLANPDNSEISSAFNDSVSKIGVLDGDSYQDWHGSANPLVFIMNNYALEGSSLSNVNAGYDPSTGNYLSFTVNSSAKNEAGEAFNPRDVLYSWTSVFSTSHMNNVDYSQYTNGNGWRLSAILNGKIISMPRLSDSLKDNGRISGSFTQKEVNKLAADLRAGSLTYTPEIVSETTISPELGAKERSQGLFATFIAFMAVILIMIGYYRFAGVIASIAVVFNILIIWAVLQNLGASLTLAGIAGIILTIGMAVDANVLIFERIREENEVSDNLAKSIASGYQKAFSAILDSNITTIIAALILLNFDAGPVKGFALTLIIGIVSSMFTALYMTRTFFSFWQKKGKKQTLKMLNLFPDTNFNFLKYGKLAIVASSVVIALGSMTLYEQRHSLFGIDFTGGMTLEVDVAYKAGLNAKNATEHAFLQAGMKPSEFSIRELGSPNNLKIFFSNSLNHKGRPFHGLTKTMPKDDMMFSFEKNPKLYYIVCILHKGGVDLTQKSLMNLDKNFTSISGQMSETMRNNAIFGLCLALLSILIYITVRFEFTYAVSATIGLAFDLMLTLALLGIFKLCGLPLLIDLNTIAALMTIIGYSLNDTIIVFDRIRADLKVKRAMSLREVINYSLNKTLSRTIMTSLTTLVVLMSLVILGGRSIFNFSFLMMLGVIIGTLSTLFISSTFLYAFKRKEDKKSKQVSTVKVRVSLNNIREDS